MATDWLYAEISTDNIPLDLLGMLIFYQGRRDSVLMEQMGYTLPTNGVKQRSLIDTYRICAAYEVMRWLENWYAQMIIELSKERLDKIMMAFEQSEFGEQGREAMINEAGSIHSLGEAINARV